MMDTKPLHPLHQIAETPSHRLLLKQWLKDEELILHRIALKETQLDTTRREITQLYYLFFIFQSTLLLLLYCTVSGAPPESSFLCKRYWIPSICSLVSSLGLIWAIRYKSDNESHLQKLLERELEDSSMLTKCVEELKKKGLDFDLVNEVDAFRRAKSLRVESKVVRKWSGRDFVSLFFITVSCLVLGLVKVIVCS